MSPDRYGAMDEAGSYRSHRNLHEIPFPPPVHGYPGLSSGTARPPMKGAGGGLDERPGGRGVSTNTVQPEMQETGEGVGSRNNGKIWRVYITEPLI